MIFVWNVNLRSRISQKAGLSLTKLVFSIEHIEYNSFIVKCVIALINISGPLRSIIYSDLFMFRYANQFRSH